MGANILQFYGVNAQQWKAPVQRPGGRGSSLEDGQLGDAGGFEERSYATIVERNLVTPMTIVRETESELSVQRSLALLVPQ